MGPSELSDHWQRIEELFYTALELDPESRPAFLQQACGANLELQREVESLLDSSQKTVGGFVREAVLRVARQQTTGLQPSGKRVGAYQLLTVIGEGGMGSVYLATRADDSYHQQVAIKLMHPGFGSSQGVLVRFSAERQILASLNHPNIARLLDGGMTTDGMPYLVMEYVEGVAIDEYCRQNNLSIDGRLQLFRTVCAAVEYAHKHLVVHRDIKPANILVTSEGVPKLLDFGIAKLLDPQAGSAALTRTGEQLMTPEYASPEQILGDPITTATDVYALGVLLYELLVGERPFDLRTKRPLEIAQIISEQSPELPSKMAEKSPCGHATDATRKLKGDLDHIVLMAMRKEPSRRYTSVAAFSGDVQAYLTGFSVQAHTDTWRYRGGKFVRRHKVAVSMTILSLVALIGFGVGLALLAKRADQQRLAAQREAEFLGSIFDAATPQAAKGDTITARQLLDQGAQRIDSELAAAPDVQATALFNLGTAYRQLGATEQAEALLQRAYELRRKLYGEGNLDVADAASALAEVYRLEAQYAKAELLFRQALAAAQKAPGENTRIVSEIFARLGFCLYLDSQDAAAESALRKSLTLSPNDTNAAFRQSELALVLDRKGDVTGAWQVGTLAIEALERREGPNSPNLIGARNNLNEVLRDSGNLKEAEKVEREILALWRRIAGNHVDVAWGLNNLGIILLAEGNWKEAQSVLWEALSVRQEHLGGNNPLVAASLLNCGRVLQAKGDYSGAEKYFRQSLDMLHETTGPQNWSVESALKNFALLQLDRGDYAGAEPYAEQALEMSRKLGGDTNPEVATMLTIRGVGRELQGDAAGAEPLLRSALEIRKALFSPGHPAIVSAETRLGEALTSEGEFQLAEPILREAVNTAHTAPFPLLPWQVAEPERALGVCLGELGHAAEAESLLRNSRTPLASYPVAALRRWMLQRGERP
jgi:eukaryotic-like serine/threonine-protein kinase